MMKRVRRIRNKTAAAAAAICALLMLGSCAAEDIFSNLPGENATELYASSIDEDVSVADNSAAGTDASSADAAPDSAAEALAASQADTSSVAETKPEERIVAVTAPPNPYAADYFLDGETDQIKDAYRKLYEGIFGYQSTIELPEKTIQADQIEDFLNFVLKTGSSLNQPGSRYEVFVDGENYVTKVSLSYPRDLKTGMDMYDALMKRVDELVKEAEPLLNDYDKLKYFHDTIINNCVYDAAAPNAHTAYGALCEGRAVCDGYAMAFQLLCEKAGLAAIPVYGKGTDYTGKVVDHIWNKVVCGGEWFVVDVTWDDPVGNDQVLRYDYFLIDDATSARSLTTTSNRFMNAPAALNAYGDFYSRNGLVIDYNSDIYYQFNNLLTSQMTDGWKDIALDFRCLDQNLFNQIKQEYFTVLADGGKGFDNVLRDQFMEPGEAIKYTCSENENVYSYHITVSKGNDQITEGNTNAN